MSADGNLKFTSITQPAAVSHKKQTERFCVLCDLPLQGNPPVLLKSGESVHVECYFRMHKKAPKRQTY
jgi:hypothetical protein